MTEAEWLVCKNLDEMRPLVFGKGKNRKFRLLACACCRRVLHQLTDSRSRHAIEISELFADGQASQEQLTAAHAALERWEETPEGRQMHIICDISWTATRDITADSRDAAWDAWDLARAADWNVAMELADRASPPEVDEETFLTIHAQYREPHAALLRDIFGNPFRPRPSVKPAWLTWKGGIICKLAQAIYDERAFDRMPILADALEDAGCDNADILAHCRSEGPHVRGCWVVDLLLGKE
jgi:hypothetical protein